MKRIVWFFMSTVTALVLLFGYHTSTSSRSSGETAIAAPLQSGSTTAPSSAGQSSVATTAPGATSPAPSSTSAPTSSTTGAASSTTVTGSTAQTRWGPVQVQLTVQAGTITDVSVLQYPNGNRRDQEINATALPILVKETLSAQNANIDMVSGATVTSDGYLTSLQSALDQAGL
jgi:uncharacterized protein with FMN-binding domain